MESLRSFIMKSLIVWSVCFALGGSPVALAQNKGESEAPKTVDVSKSVAGATKENPYVNSLGMKFVPVPIAGGPTDGQKMLFSIWDTRVKDFEAFVTSTGYDATGGMQSLDKDRWTQHGATGRKPGFLQGPTHPVVGVSWYDAKAFCKWLTKKERKEGKIGAKDEYRLPSDHEWSCAVEIGDREKANATPHSNDDQIAGVYPWGKESPPPKGAGNYADETFAKEHPELAWIEGYDDGYAYTSPVGSFKANENGLYDMGGNVWQWCEDWLD